MRPCGGAAGLFVNDKVVFKEYNRNGHAYPIEYIFDMDFETPQFPRTLLKHNRCNKLFNNY